jgi:hypothetical protein
MYRSQASTQLKIELAVFRRRLYRAIVLALGIRCKLILALDRVESRKMMLMK